MPWLLEAKKDVISCDKLRGLANTNRSADFRMGQPSWLKTSYLSARRRSKPGELKHLSNRRRRKQFSDCASSGERTRRSPNHTDYGQCGVVGPQHGLKRYSRTGLERPTIEGDSPVYEISFIPSGILSTAGSETPCRKLPAPSGKAKYS